MVLWPALRNATMCSRSAVESLQNRFAALDMESDDGSAFFTPREDDGNSGPDDGASKTTGDSTEEDPLPPERAVMPYDFYAVLDFECTCDYQGWHQHEIIEFPVVFLNARTLQVDMVFRRYVRPTERPRLTEFCVQLTGIQQADIDRAPTLDVVLLEFSEFLEEHCLVGWRSERSVKQRLFVICTDGPWDVMKFLRPECMRKHIRLAEWWGNWIDVRSAFAHALACRRKCISEMLMTFGLTFEGRQHSGVDDAQNIARIVAELLKRGCKLTAGTRRM